VRVQMRLLTTCGLALVLCGGALEEKGWRQARDVRPFSFPNDHGAHPEYRIEWWYYTGNLAAADGQRFGYQLTFFRIGVDSKPENPSRWAVRDLYMAHLAVTDVHRQQFQFADRINRAGVGWAGADSGTLNVWNKEWRAYLDEKGLHQLHAHEAGIGVDLALASEAPPVLHGDRGLSRKGDRTGNATYYYSITRLDTSGAIVLDGKTIPVHGLSWMDHEFGTSFLQEGQQGWDWVSIQLDDGSSGGTWKDSHGVCFGLQAGDFELQPMRLWHSQASRAIYPVEWKIHLPGKRLDLAVRAVVDNQELRPSHSEGIVYWEGAIEVSGKHEEKAVKGRGYLEMTGYAGPPLSGLVR
jgi:predicted secreted hydrolase